MHGALRNARPSPRVEESNRLEAVNAAVASARIEGVPPSCGAQEILQDYASGSIEDEEMVSLILAMHRPGA